MTLSQLPPGTTATVCGAVHDPRLTALGLTPGTKITPLFTAPSKNPTAYLFRGTLLALRLTDAANIHVTPVPGT